MMERKTTVFIALCISLIIILITLSFLPLVISPANQWANTTTQINTLKTLGYDGSGVTIGIIDTGVDITHQEFDPISFHGWTDCIHHKETYYDDDDQGTHLAGLLVSQSSYQGLFQGIHLKGIAQNATIIIAKTIPQNQYLYGGGNDTAIADGISFCIQHHADIILLSLGMSPEDVDFTTTNKTTQMITQAIQQGIFIVAPAGNDRQDDDGDVCFPAILEHVIAVGSISKSDSISSFSSTGHQYPWSTDPHKKPELVAPGEHLLSTRTEGAYGHLSGTSQAATYVTGVLALLLDAYPEFKHDGAKNQNETTIQLFKEILATTAKKIGSLQEKTEEFSHDDSYGYGLIQAYDAYQELAKY